ncbi:MAG: hypothetical protein Q7S22_03795 [Candidatus Micrarchaeota archaeon]|nr:hypothetical protein [Candidatus Micrarchaeota archaeon]
MTVSRRLDRIVGGGNGSGRASKTTHPLHDGINNSGKKLVEIYGLDAQPGSDQHKEIRRELDVYPGFVSTYHRWRFDKKRVGSVESIAHALEFSPLFSQIIAENLGIKAESEDFEAKLCELLKQRTNGEIKELYDSIVKVMEDGTPSMAVYHEFIDAYSRILRECERASYTGSILERFVRPRFGTEGFLDKTDLHEILKGVPEEELKKAGLLLFDIKLSGITVQELNEYQRTWIEKDRFRNGFHNEIKAYALTLGIDEVTVMADIVFSYNGGNHVSVDHENKQLILNAGVLFIYGMGAENEGDCTIPENGSEYFSESTKERIADAKEALAHYLDPKHYQKGQYRSHIITGNNENEDIKIFEQIKQENPGLSVAYSFEPSHAAHGRFAYSLKLRMELGEMLDGNQDSQRKLEELVRNVRAHCKT